MSKTRRVELTKTELEKAAGQGHPGARSALAEYLRFEKEGKSLRAWLYNMLSRIFRGATQILQSRTRKIDVDRYI